MRNAVRSLSTILGGILAFLAFLIVFLAHSDSDEIINRVFFGGIFAVLAMAALDFGTRRRLGMTAKSHLIMRLWQFLGVALFAYGADHLVWIVILNVGHWSFGTRLIQGILAMLYWQGGMFCLHRARKHRALSTRLVESDSRKPVLYLRPFADDRATARAVGSPFMMLREFNLGSLTDEEQLCEVFSVIGPFRAIGKPGEKLPELGAAREYIERNWLDVVVERMSEAAMVVIRASPSPGLLEEVDKAIQQVNPERLIILAPAAAKQYKAFCEVTRSRFPQGLPPPESVKLAPNGGTLGGIIYFQNDWSPHFVALVRLPWLSIRWLLSAGRPLNPRLTKALDPVFKRIGVTPQRHPVSWSLVLIRLAYVIIVFVSVVFVLYIFVEH